MESVGGLMGPSPLDTTHKKKKSIYIYNHIQLGPKKRNRIGHFASKSLTPSTKLKLKLSPNNTTIN